MRHWQFVFSVLCVPFLLTLSACGPVQGYVGPELASDQVARINHTFGFYLLVSEDIGVSAVDGMELAAEPFAAPSVVEVLPGRRILKLRLRFDTAQQISWMHYDAEVVLKPGVDYNVDFQTLERKRYVWIEESQSKELIWGAKGPGSNAQDGNLTASR